jgi:hypothetical protein
LKRVKKREDLRIQQFKDATTGGISPPLRPGSLTLEPLGTVEEPMRKEIE